MTEPITAAELARLDELCAKATEEPWEFVGTENGHEIRIGTAIAGVEPGRYESQHLIAYHHELQPEDGEQWREAFANCEMICESRTALPRLTAEVRRLQNQFERYVELLTDEESLRCEAERGRIAAEVELRRLRTEIDQYRAGMK